MTDPSFAFGIAGTGGRVYLLFGPELVLEWAPSYPGAVAHFHYRADIYGHGAPPPCDLRGVDVCWLRSGPLTGDCLDLFVSDNTLKIEAAMRADFESAAERVRAVLAAGAR